VRSTVKLEVSWYRRLAVIVPNKFCAGFHDEIDVNFTSLTYLLFAMSTQGYHRSPSPSPFRRSPSRSASPPTTDSSNTSILLRRYLPARASRILISLHSNAKAWLYFGLTTASLLLLLSNSFTRLFRTIWSDVGDNWAVIWSYVVSFGFSHATLYIVGSSVLHILVYWSYALLLLAFDCMTATHALSQYKVQPTKNIPVDRSTLYTCIKQALTNQLLIAAPLNALTYPIAVWRGVGFDLPLPSFERFCYDVAVFLVCEEILFYYVHRLMHTPAFYGRFHKRHHEWTAPIAIATHYCHPLEHLLANLLPAMLGPLLCSSHISVIWVWQSVATITSVNTHSGYHLPFMPSPEAHDFHHLRFSQPHPQQSPLAQYCAVTIADLSLAVLCAQT